MSQTTETIHTVTTEDNDWKALPEDEFRLLRDGIDKSKLRSLLIDLSETSKNQELVFVYQEKAR